MLNPIGAPTRARPSSAVMQEALNLLSALGSNKDTKDLLEQMLQAQMKNGELIEKAEEIIDQAAQRDVEVTEREATLHRNTIQASGELERKRQGLADREGNLEGKKDQFASDMRIRMDELEARRETLDRRRDEGDVELGEERVRVETLEADVIRREGGLADERLLLDTHKGVLDQRTSALDDLEAELGQLSERLDQRDNRLLAAMEGEGN